MHQTLILICQQLFSKYPYIHNIVDIFKICLVIMFNVISSKFCLNLTQNDIEDGKECVNNFPFIAAPIVYSPPPVTSIVSIVGEIGSKSHLGRNKSSVVRKSHTSDDELDELKSPLSSIFLSTSSSPANSTKPSLKLKEIHKQSPVRYELLRDVWMNSE